MSGCLLAIEPEDYTAAEVQALKRAGNVVLAYLNAGAIENYRSYYKQLEKYTLRKLDDWEDERYLDVCEPLCKTGSSIEAWRYSALAMTGYGQIT